MSAGVTKTRRKRQRAAEVRGALLRECLREFDLLMAMEQTLPESDLLRVQIGKLLNSLPNLEEADFRWWGLWHEAVVELARRRVC